VENWRSYTLSDLCGTEPASFLLQAKCFGPNATAPDIHLQALGHYVLN